MSLSDAFMRSLTFEWPCIPFHHRKDLLRKSVVPMKAHVNRLHMIAMGVLYHYSPLNAIRFPL